MQAAQAREPAAEEEAEYDPRAARIAAREAKAAARREKAAAKAEAKAAAKEARRAAKEAARAAEQEPEELIDDIEAGRKYMKVYKQMKMYNDPALNPVLYAK